MVLFTIYERVDNMYIFCSKALTDALNIKKSELQKMTADAHMDDLYAC